VHGAAELMPPSVMVGSLAKLRRAFSAIEARALDSDHAWCVWSGHMADALHNVPHAMWRHDSSSRVHWWTHKGFIGELQRMGAPAEIDAVSRGILQGKDDHLQLGLPSGSVQLHLPPHDHLAAFLDSFYEGCLMIRTLRMAGRHDDPGGRWAGAEARWDAELETFVRLCVATAGVLAELAPMIADWRIFDAETWETSARARLALVPPSHHEAWLRCVLPVPR
jgi:hypothetical protein